MALTPSQQERLVGLADELGRRGFAEGGEFKIQTGTRRHLQLSSEYVLLRTDDESHFEVGTRDMGRFNVSVRTSDLDEAVPAFLEELVRLVRGRRGGLAQVDVSGLPVDTAL